MILITGGAYSGKREAANKLFGLQEDAFADGRDCSREELFLSGGILRLDAYIRRMLDQGENPENLAQELQENNPEAVVLIREVGCGVIPQDPKEIRFREVCGRISIELAEMSRQVYRVVCGIPLCIKQQKEQT